MDKERKVEEFASRLGDLLQEITELTSMCDNSVARRVRNHLYKNTLPLAKEFDVELQQPLRYCDGPGGPGDRVLSTNEVLDEFQADDRRRSVFIDPEESATVNLVDLFSGRLTTIEFRDPNDILDVSKIVTSALKIMREEYPVVTINYSLAKNKEEILYLLRSLVTEIENGEGLTLRENCSRNKELLGTRWTNNGRTLERGYVIKETCQI